MSRKERSTLTHLLLATLVASALNTGLSLLLVVGMIIVTKTARTTFNATQTRAPLPLGADGARWAERGCPTNGHDGRGVHATRSSHDRATRRWLTVTVAVCGGGGGRRRALGERWGAQYRNCVGQARGGWEWMSAGGRRPNTEGDVCDPDFFFRRRAAVVVVGVERLLYSVSSRRVNVRKALAKHALPAWPVVCMYGGGRCAPGAAGLTGNSPLQVAIATAACPSHPKL